MAATIETLVDAVAARLTAASYSQDVTATKSLFPYALLEDVDALTVQVYGGPESWGKETRGAMYSRMLDVVVAVKAPCERTNTAIGGYLQLVEEIKKDLATYQASSSHALGEILQSEPYSVQALLDTGLFLAQVTFRYRGFAI